MEYTLHYNFKKYNPITDFEELMDDYITGIAGNFQIVDDELNRVENQSNMLKTGWDEFQTFPTLTFDNNTRTLTIEGNGSKYWLNNTQYSLDVDVQIQISTQEGLHFIFFNNSGIQESTTPWEMNYSICPVTVIYWDNTNSKYLFMEYEFHKWVMQANLHQYLHLTRGTSYAFGLQFSLISQTLGQITTGQIFDEDIQLNIGSTIGSTQLLNPLQAPIYYRDGINANLRKIDATSNLCYLNPAPQINVNNGGNWELQAVQNNRYFVYWLLATNDIDKPIILMPGTAQGATQGDADQQNTLFGMNFSNVDIAEFVVLSRIMMIASPTSYQIVQVDDYRSSRTESSYVAPVEELTSLIDVVPTIADRDAIQNPPTGKEVHVIDATADITVYADWARYMYDGSEWIKINEADTNTSFGIFYQSDGNDYEMITTGINTFTGNKVEVNLFIDRVAGGLTIDGVNKRIVHSGKPIYYAFNATATVRDPSAPDMEVRFVLIKNGTTQINPSLSFTQIESLSGAASLDASSGVYMEDGDYVEVYCKTDKLNGEFWVNNMQLQFIEVPQ